MLSSKSRMLEFLKAPFLALNIAIYVDDTTL